MRQKKYAKYSMLFCAIFAFFAFFLRSEHGYATAWEAYLHPTAVPQRVVAVDKKEQTFFLYDEKNLQSPKFTYTCTTGRKHGDKQIRNDLRTPEGVYFVEYKIAKGLDFKKYGGIAYTLNYPNPVDKLHGKTGYGIWIHSKGEGIQPYSTEGCIAIDLEDIAEVGPMLTPGTAVVVGEKLGGVQAPKDGTDVARHLRMRMDQWTRAWASRSDSFFSYYDSDAYSKAMPESFAAFKANKVRLFKLLSWINIFNRDVHVLEGPGYWVTWAEQFYRAPNLATEGIRRLYWKRAENDEFRIVGMEWIPRDVGMQAAYEKGQLVAANTTRATDAAISEEMRAEMPKAPPLSMPETPENEHLDASKEVPPVPVIPFGQVEGQGTTVAVLPQGVSQQEGLSLRENLQQRIDAWVKAWQSRKAKEFFAFYNNKVYGLLEQVPSAPLRDVTAERRRDFTAPWIHIAHRPAQMDMWQQSVRTITDMWIHVGGKKAIQGQSVLYWQQDEKDVWRIVGSQWITKDVNMHIVALEAVSSELADVIERWRNDWEAGNLEAYLRYYADDAWQQGKRKTTIAAQKKRVWAKAAPKEVQLHGLRFQFDAQGVRVDMTQTYTDTKGYTDKGTKVVLMQPGKDGWYIVNEEWTALPAQ